MCATGVVSRRSLLLSTIFGAVSAAGLTACGQAAAPASQGGAQPAAAHAKNVKLTYWDPIPRPVTEDVYKKIIANYEAKNPGVTVEFLGVPQQTAREKYINAVSTDSAPDVAFNSFLSELSAMNVLVDLTPYLDKWPEKSSFSNDVWDSLKFQSGGEAINALPMWGTTDALWYRTDWFKEKNLPAPDTYQQMEAAARELTDKTNNRYGFTMRGGQGGYAYMINWMLSFAGATRLFSDDGTCQLSQPDFVKGLEWYASLHYNGYTPPSSVTDAYQQMVGNFGSGTAAMMQHNNGSIAENKKNLKEGTFMSTPLPLGPKDKRAVPDASPLGPSVFKSSKNIDEAVKFALFLCEADQLGPYCEAGAVLPMNKKVFDQDWIKTDPYWPGFIKSLSDPKSNVYRLPLYLPEWAQFTETVALPSGQNLLTKKNTPEATAEIWAQFLTTAMKRYLKDHPGFKP